MVESTNRGVGPSVDEKFGEAYAEYLGKLGDAVDNFADWNDPHQVCIFVHEPYNPGSKFAAKIAAHASIAIPCLLDMSNSDIGAYRAESIAVLVQALAKGKGDVEARYVQAAKQQILKGLHDQDAVVRGETVVALGSFGETGMIPALQQVARSDPGSEARTDSDTQWFPIREEAAKAITQIQQREGQK
ncbi:MAG: HEAT repeat domain-containing protein [Candidatus Sulfotelmatobacter sp.]